MGIVDCRGEKSYDFIVVLVVVGQVKSNGWGRNESPDCVNLKFALVLTYDVEEVPINGFSPIEILNLWERSKVRLRKNTNAWLAKGAKSPPF